MDQTQEGRRFASCKKLAYEMDVDRLPFLSPAHRALRALLVTLTFRGSRFNVPTERMRCSVTFHGKLNPTLLSAHAKGGWMAPGAVLDPSSEHVAWLEANHDVTCRWAGVGTAGQVGEPSSG